MPHRRPRIALAVLATLALLVTVPVRAATVEGRWEGRVTIPGAPAPLRYAVELQAAGDGAIRGRFSFPSGLYYASWLAGRADDDGAGATVTGNIRGSVTTFTLRADGAGDRLTGLATSDDLTLPIDARRTAATAEVPAPIIVDFKVPRPVTVHRNGLDDETSAMVQERILAAMDEHRMVGLSLALVRRGKVVDVRSYGWQDFDARVPASNETRYRWGSISKPLTAILALQLVEEGRLDLDADVRTYVPEWPEKPHAVTARQCILHTSGIVHYHLGRVKRTWRDHGVPHPFEDRIPALDMFKESDLLFTPGQDRSYSTPAYALLGAVVERAAGTPYHVLAEDRIAKPLGMTGFEPDFKSREIPQRTHGYLLQPDGRVWDSGDSDVSWKLPAGGFVSTVEDLARFAAGMMSDALLPEAARERMWTEQQTESGEWTGSGFGIVTTRIGEHLFLSHGGAQRKCSAYMMAAPGSEAAVAIMCNTERSNLRPMAQALLQLVIE